MLEAELAGVKSGCEELEKQMQLVKQVHFKLKSCSFEMRRLTGRNHLFNLALLLSDKSWRVVSSGKTNAAKTFLLFSWILVVISNQ
jgi:hypothetical protein